MDYNDFKSDKDPSPKKKKSSKARKEYGSQSEGVEGFWWREEDPETRAQMVQAAANTLKNEQRGRHNQNLMNARLYGNVDLLGFGARQYNYLNVLGGGVAFNVISSASDALTAKVGKQRPRPSFVTDGAIWSQQQKAKRLDRFTRGMFQEAKVYVKDRLFFLDSCVFGTGCYKVFISPETDKVDIERVFVDDILVDDADARYGKPRQLFQKTLCHREVLMENFGDSEERRTAIEDAVSPPDVERRGFGDMVEVIEVWHLKSGKKSKDGKHAIVLDGKELFCEEWKMNRFPFVFHCFKPKLLGMWGEGVAEMLTGIQLELNRLMTSITQQLRRKGRGRILMPMSAKVPPEHITNAVADVIYYNGNVAPHVDNMNAVAPEEFQQIDRLYQKAFQIVGVSELSVSSKKPSGLDAGVALREFEDIESERFAKQHQEWDSTHMELAEVMLEVVRHFGGKDYVTEYEHKQFTETIKWEDINCEPGEYQIQMFPSSSLPTTPAARRQAVKELMADGFIDKAVAQRLLDFPDLDAESNLGNAAIDDVDATIEAILYADKPTFTMPDKYQNLELLAARATSSYLFAKHRGAPEKRLAMMRRLIDAALGQANSAAASAPAAQMGGQPQGPGGPPMPPPGPGGAMGNMTQTTNMNMPLQPAVPPLVAGA